MNDAIIPKLFLNSELSDVKVLIELEDGRSLLLPGHKLILKSVSKVFKVMLENDKFKEGTTNVMEIQVPGDEHLAFKFLRFLYTKDLDDLDLDHYCILTKVSHMYDIETLHAICEERISMKLTPYSVCRLHTSLEKYVSEKFKLSCLDLMLASAFIIFEKNFHLFLTEETMKAVLESEKLNVLDEHQALKALLRWGHMKCLLKKMDDTVNAKLLVSGLLPSIYWHLIEDEQFNDLIKEYKPNSDGIVKQRKRAEEPSLNVFVESWDVRENAFKSGWLKSDDSQYTKLVSFSVTCNIMLVGLDLEFTLIGGQSNWKQLMTFQVQTVSVKENSFSKNVWIGYNSHGNVYRVKAEFHKPMLLKQGETHVINLDFVYSRSFSSVASSVFLPKYTLKVHEKQFSRNVILDLNRNPCVFVSKLYYFVL